MRDWTDDMMTTKKMKTFSPQRKIRKDLSHKVAAKGHQVVWFNCFVAQWLLHQWLPSSMQMVVVMLPPLCYWWCTLQDRYYSWSCIMSMNIAIIVVKNKPEDFYELKPPWPCHWSKSKKMYIYYISICICTYFYCELLSKLSSIHKTVKIKYMKLRLFWQLI